MRCVGYIRGFSCLCSMRCVGYICGFSCLCSMRCVGYIRGFSCLCSMRCVGYIRGFSCLCSMRCVGYIRGFSCLCSFLFLVALSTKPKDPSAILEAERSEGKRRRGKGRKKGKGKKRNPCLKKYKDFCIHGSCHYLRDIKAPSCICHPSYSGERCHLFTLASEGRDVGGYSRTTALAVVAVVLSSVCLTIIGLLLVLRFHKRGAYDVEHEKVKLGSAPNY
uniref:Proheparin-binding EGF-like growth factor n=1 Tax=Salmo trutta TaxID=8032 RepID=A0A673W3V9_SALTR